MKIELTINSDNPDDIRQAEAVLAALRATPAQQPNTTTPPVMGTEEQKLKKLLKAGTGKRLKKWVEGTTPEQQLDLREVGRLLGLQDRQVVALLAKLGSTQRSWGIRLLTKHEGDTIRYSMPRSIFETVRRLLNDQQTAGNPPQTTDPTEGETLPEDEQAA
jgi:hypothetical protein